MKIVLCCLIQRWKYQQTPHLSNRVRFHRRKIKAIFKNYNHRCFYKTPKNFLWFLQKRKLIIGDCSQEEVFIAFRQKIIKKSILDNSYSKTTIIPNERRTFHNNHFNFIEQNEFNDTKNRLFWYFSQYLSLLFQLISTPSPNYEEGTYAIQRFGSEKIKIFFFCFFFFF